MRGTSMEAEHIEDTGETTLPGQGGDTAEQGAEAAEGAQARTDAGEDADDKDLKGKLAPEVQEKIDRRIGKLTAKAKAAEERAAQKEQELERLRAERDEAESAKFAHLPVMPEYLDAEARKGISDAESELAEAERAERAWTAAAQSDEGHTDKQTGKAYTPAECAKFAAAWARKAGFAEARRESIVSAARRRQEADLREFRASKAKPKPGAGAPEVPAKPKPNLKDADGGGGDRSPAAPPDIQRRASPPKPPQTQNDAKKFWKRF